MGSRLASQSSAYLRSAAHQPVDWYPWGTEAFERARQENKPILLDVGAVWCHWCHVMDGESYENGQVAEALNRDWICVKVDRDERPDVDARYQRAVQAVSGEGGWPLTAFLTPDGQVFYGGTYFPPDGARGRPGLLTLLTELARIHREQPDRVATQARQVAEHLAAHGEPGAPGTVSDVMLDHAIDDMARVFDARHGGFGTQPKFPHPGACELLLARWFDTRESSLRDMVDHTLTAMARGGVYDQIGGGFHRYSVDARWIVPHFEKMSYDNSELLRLYVHAAASSAASAASAAGREEPQERGERQSEYQRVIEGTIHWAATVLAQPGGGFGASQDADGGLDDDGDYFTWTPDEARAVLTGDEVALVARHYDIADAGEMHHDPRKNVLWVRQSAREIAAGTGRPLEQVAALLDAGRRKLMQARAARTAPAVDPAVYAGWNAMMASALLEAAALLSWPHLEQLALATLERVFREGAERDGAGGVVHALAGAPTRILEDQVQVASGAVDAFETTGDPIWLRRALALAEYVWSTFAAEDGGLYDLPRDYAGEGFLTHRLKPVQDAPAPSGNGVAALLAARLAEHTGHAEWRARSELILQTFAGSLPGLSLYAATLLRAADWLLHPPAHVVIVGAADDPLARELTLAARRAYHPRKVLTRLEPGADGAALPAPLRAMLDATAPRAYLCAGRACAAPTADPGALAAAITTFGTPVRP